jgi:hypothetical protein
VTVRNLTFARACEEALIAVMDAIATVGEERWGHLQDAKLAVERALHDSHRAEEWFVGRRRRNRRPCI